MAKITKIIPGVKNPKKQQKQALKQISYPKWGSMQEMVQHIDEAIESTSLPLDGKSILKSLFEDFGSCIMKNEQVCMYIVDELQ